MKASFQSHNDSDASLHGFLGDLAGLTEQIGGDGAKVSVGDAIDGGPFQLSGVVDLKSLRKFLVEYRNRLMVPIELPTIIQASLMVERGEFRELMDLDQSLSRKPEMKIFSESSRWIGQCHARTMRGMKDHRTVWRYCDAIRTKTAFGWHPVVYGVVLAAFSIPVRQGIVNYCEQVINGFADSAAARLDLGGKEVALMKTETIAEMALLIDHAIEGNSGAELRVL
jgi:urease accessory protein UreF